jgi:hypothetical protein
MLRTSSGLPLPGRELNIRWSDIDSGTVVTDKFGNFNASYLVTGSESPGDYTLSIYELNDEGIPAISLYTSHLILIPYSKSSLSTSFLVIIAIVVVAIFVIRSRRFVRMPKRDVDGKVAEPIAKPYVSARPVALKEIAQLNEATVKAGIQRPSPTGSTRAISHKEKQAIKPLTKQKALPTFQIASEIASINTAIGDGKLKWAMMNIYIVSRNIALVHGFDVPDSMTHREFFLLVTGKDPKLAGPLLHIINPYEKSSFSGQEAGRAELNDAVNGLKEFYMGFENTGVREV